MTSSIKFISLLSFLIKITTAADTVEATLLVGDIGGNISMTCSNNGVTWVKGEYYNYADPITTTTDDDNTITINDDVTLVINTLSVQHVDNYWCLDTDGDTVIGYTLVVQDFQCTSSSLSPYEYSNRCYWLSDESDDGRSTYTNYADQDCIDNDGWNVFPTDEDTNTFICDTFSVIGPTEEWLWLGITDPEANNEYVYISGEPLTDSSWWNWAYGDGDDGDEYYTNNGEDTYDCVIMGYNDDTEYTNCNLGKCCWIAMISTSGTKRDVACQSKDISLTSVTTSVRENTETTIGIVSYDGSDLETALYISTLTTQATNTTNTTVVYSFNRDEAGIVYISSTDTTPGIATQYYFKLYVDYAPTAVTISSSSDTSADVEGTKLVLTCIYEESNPIPDSYSWWVNGEEMIDESNQNLTINVTYDEVVYQCGATNIVNTTRSDDTTIRSYYNLESISIWWKNTTTLAVTTDYDMRNDMYILIIYYTTENQIEISEISDPVSHYMINMTDEMLMLHMDSDDDYVFFLWSCVQMLTCSSDAYIYMVNSPEPKEVNYIAAVAVVVVLVIIIIATLAATVVYLVVKLKRLTPQSDKHHDGIGEGDGDIYMQPTDMIEPRPLPTISVSTKQTEYLAPQQPSNHEIEGCYETTDNVKYENIYRG